MVDSPASETHASANDDDSIGLADFINQVKEDLSSAQVNTPTQFIESIEIEMQVTVKKEGTAGFKLGVPFSGNSIGAEVGGRLGRDDVQKVTVKLGPLHNKEQLLDLYLKLNPGKGLGVMEEELRMRFKNARSGADVKLIDTVM